MNNIEKQILIGSSLGDGHITQEGKFLTGSKYKEWVDYKIQALSNYCSSKAYRFIAENGFSKTPHHTMSSLTSSEIKNIGLLSLKDKLDQLDDLGLAIWFYDDGSLHKDKLFYNLNTHSFSYTDHVKFLIPALLSFGVHPTLTSERKSDGRKFWYIRINKRDGAELINHFLKKIPIKCYSYKTRTENINDTIKHPYIHVTNGKSGVGILYNSKASAATYTGVSSYRLSKVLNTLNSIDGYIFSTFIYGVQRPERELVGPSGSET